MLFKPWKSPPFDNIDYIFPFKYYMGNLLDKYLCHKPEVEELANKKYEGNDSRKMLSTCRCYFFGTTQRKNAFTMQVLVFFVEQFSRKLLSSCRCYFFWDNSAEKMLSPCSCCFFWNNTAE